MTVALSILFRARCSPGCGSSYSLLLSLYRLPIVDPIILRCVQKYTLPSGPVVRITGLREPCGQINNWRDGLL